MPQEAKQEVLLIDLENCPKMIEQLKQDLQCHDKVVVCYATSHAMIPLDWLVPLSQAIADNRLTIHQMQHTGKNAADFGLFYFAGQLSERYSEASRFKIVSDDSDLEHLVGLLHDSGFEAYRFGKEAKAPSHTAAKEPDPEDVLRSMCQALINHPTNRPKTKTALKNHLRTQARQNAECARHLLHSMMENKIIAFQGKKVEYQESGLVSFAWGD